MGRFPGLLVLTLVMISTSSCKKSNDVVPEPKCKLDWVRDNARALNYYYVYTDNLLTEVRVPGGRYKIEYSNNRPIRRSLLGGASVLPSDKHEIIYNGQGLLQRIELYELVNYQNAQYYMYGKFEFGYQNGVLKTISIFSITNNIPTLELKADYVINSAGNVTDCHLTDYLPTVQTADVHYTHDSLENYYRQNNSFAYLIDPLFFDWNPARLPLAYSKNNVTGIEENGITSNLAYRTDAKGNLKYIILNGYSPAYTFYYVCP